MIRLHHFEKLRYPRKASWQWFTTVQSQLWQLRESALNQISHNFHKLTDKGLLFQRFCKQERARRFPTPLSTIQVIFSLLGRMGKSAMATKLDHYTSGNPKLGISRPQQNQRVTTTW